MEQLSEAKTSHGSLSLRIVLRVRLIFGFYSAINARTSMRVLARLYCLCLACIIISTILIIANKNSISIIFVLLDIVEYIIIVLISLLTGEKHFFNFCKIIEQVDRKMGFAHLAPITPVAQKIFIFICLLRLLHFIVYLIFILIINFKWLPVIGVFLNTALSLSNIVNIISLDLLRQRLILLRRALTHVRACVSHQIKAINDSLVTYKTLIDNWNAMFFWNKPQIVASFFNVFASFMLYGYRAQKSFAENPLKTLIRSLELLFNGAFACLPPIFIELVIREVDKLKVVIGNQLIECDDTQLSRELEMARRYLEERPFRVSILRVLVLDASFVMTFTGFCISSLIVLVQTTGLI